MTRNRKSTWRPRLEALESRWCPACDVRLIGSTLFVTGDSADNDIAITNFGSGDLHVEADGVIRDFTEMINRVVVRAGDGGDSVFAADYDFEFVGGISRAWLLDLGNGDDEASVNLFGLLDAPASVTVLGGAGDDNIFVAPTFFLESSFLITVAGGEGNDFVLDFSSGGVGPSGTMVVTLLGGNGDDAIRDLYDFFSVDGTFIGLSDGGNGTDLVSAVLGAFVDFDPSLPLVVAGFDVVAGAHANYAMFGGNGNDTLFANGVGRIDGQFGVLADAGNGDDTIFSNLNINVESTGQFAAILRGGNGNDHMEVQVRFFETELIEFPGFPGFFIEGARRILADSCALSTRLIVASGGSGFDTCFHSDWVTLFSIEDDQPL